MFINYDVNMGLQIRPYRAADSVYGDIGDVVEAVVDDGPNTC